jgi:hypothetical protein
MLTKENRQWFQSNYKVENTSSNEKIEDVTNMLPLKVELDGSFRIVIYSLCDLDMCICTTSAFIPKESGRDESSLYNVSNDQTE